MRRALQYVTMFDRPIIQHCETPELTQGGAMNGGPTSLRLGLPGIPAIAEELPPAVNAAWYGLTYKNIIKVDTSTPVAMINFGQRRDCFTSRRSNS